MKKMLIITLFMLATLAWAAAQQPNSVPDQGSGQSTSPNPQTSPDPAASPSSQAPGETQSQPPAPGGASQAGPQGQTGTITEGCLGGSDPNYTITDKAGATYKLNIPSNADTTKLASHVGESVQVMGDVKSSTINVQGIGKGTGKCAGSGAGATQPPPKN
jgi:hypothetical protein